MSPEPIQPRVDIYPKTIDTKWARMKYWLSIFFTFNFSLLIFHCGLDIEDPTPPSPPIWVQKSLPEEWPERGIDAHEEGGISLEWKASPEDDVIAYSIYRATYYDVNDSLGNFSILTHMEIDALYALTYIDKNVAKNIPYYYKICAVGSSGNKSDYSDSLSYTSLKIINPHSMVPNGQSVSLPQDRKLLWRNYCLNEMEDYCITVLTQENELVTRTLLQPTDYFMGEEYFQIPAESILDSGGIYRWRVDVGAQYVDNRETSGSESSWATFLYAGD